MRILIIDDAAGRTDALGPIVARACPGASIVRAHRDALETADELLPTLVVVGPDMADRAGALDLIRSLCGRRPEAMVVVTSREDRAAAAVAALKAGAADYVVHTDGDGDALVTALARLVVPCPSRRGGRQVGSEAADALGGLVGASPSMERVRGLVRTAAHTAAHVLIEGETGTGKELVARAIHALGRRASGPFVPVNCAAIPETLAESEFFGHARGAFTGAVEARPGALQLADRGTLFLDEIEDLSAALQAKLLRVVQDREVRPLGASVARRVDVRLVAASNRDLWRMVEAGQFRRDLYYRLRVLTIRLPPLRQRREDLPRLIEHFVTRFNGTHGTTHTVPPPAVLRPLLEHPWEGNVRELENTLESLLILAGASGADLADVLRQPDGALSGLWLDERTRILRVLDDHRWNRQRAAAALGISRVTLWRRMERHGIRDPFGGTTTDTG